jgi:hypothetical protein
VCSLSFAHTADSVTGRPPTYKMELRDMLCVLTLNKPYKNAGKTALASLCSTFRFGLLSSAGALACLHGFRSGDTPLLCSPFLYRLAVR